MAMDMILTAVYEEVPQSEGGGFVALRRMPGAISEGDTLEEARENLRNAIQQHWKLTARSPLLELGKTVTLAIAVSLGRV